MTDPQSPPPPAEPAPAPPELVDTSPAAPDRTPLTYAILLTVLAALLSYLIAHFLRSP